MSTELRNYFALLDGSDRDYVLSLLPPSIATLSQRQQVDYLCQLVWNIPFDGRMDEINGDTNGLTVIRWWQANKDRNEGLGPLSACGTKVHGWAAYCAALGIYTRLVGAVGPSGPDNQAEYWDSGQQSWVLKSLADNSHYLSAVTGGRMSYLEVTSCARFGEVDAFHRYSPTGGIAILPNGNHYARWERWCNDAVISNGNAAFLGKPHDWSLLRVWPPAKGQETVWTKQYLAENPPRHILYPDLYDL